jgi:predicted RNase H-like HicB family nuclease
MKDSARYRKIVEWSEEDQCFVGQAPDLFLGGCHGLDERTVFDELCQVVEEWIEIYKREGKPLPKPSPASAVKSLRKTKAVPRSGSMRST